MHANNPQKPVKTPPANQGHGNYRKPPDATKFKPGQSGNPKGRPSAGASIREWWNQMQGWSRARLEKVISDANAPVNKVAAAQVWLNACLSGGDIDRIIDHTAGKPQQAVDVTSNGETVLLPIRLDGDREL